jgi:hypothetical protein
LRLPQQRSTAANNGSKKQATGGKKFLKKLGNLVHHGTPRGKNSKNEKQSSPAATATAAAAEQAPCARYGHQMTVARLLVDDYDESDTGSSLSDNRRSGKYDSLDLTLSNPNEFDYNVYLFGG